MDPRDILVMSEIGTEFPREVLVQALRKVIADLDAAYERGYAEGLRVARAEEAE